MKLKCLLGFHCYGPLKKLKEAYRDPLCATSFLFIGALLSHGPVYGKECKHCLKVKVIR